MNIIDELKNDKATEVCGYKILFRWIKSRRDYIPYVVPQEWNCKSYTEHMTDVVNCPYCGKPIMYGECYTSRYLQTRLGMGYAVCPDCYYGVEMRPEEIV